ncbi:MAG: signal recognition particle-docking protein FtsY [Phycisphaerae bacterium]|nr:signal recognition particle-docking protein FtsY [Phycisphaerae bacterium]
MGGLRRLLRGRAIDDALIADIERALLDADVGPKAARALIDRLRADYKAGVIASGDQVVDHLKAQCKGMLAQGRVDLRLAAAPPTVILVTGINGAGKTTSIAKLARRLRGDGKTVMLAACDTFRAGAVRQLEIWAERLGVEVIKGQQGGDPAAVAFDACAAAKSRGVDVLIVDTAGRLQTQDPLMRQLAKIRSVLGKQVEGAPHESLLVLDATTGQNALRQAEEFGKAAGITGIFLSKLDGTAKGGIVLAIKSATDIPVKFVGVGETPEDAEPFDPDSFVEALFAE